MIYKKSVVLTSIDNSLKKGVLNIDNKNGVYAGNVKLYNFIEEPLGSLSLGILVENKVVKASLERVGYMAYNFSINISKLPENCTCALVSSLGEKNEPILLGSIAQKNNDLESRLISSLTLLDDLTLKNTEETLKRNNIEFDDQNEIEQEIDKYIHSECERDCKHCFYKKDFYSQSDQNQTEEYKIEQEISKGKLRVPNANNNLFFEEIGGQINQLFEKYPIEQTLADIIPNSKWVKIDYNNNQKYYVLGLISIDNQVRYVCYGVPGKWAENPPSDFNEKAQWLPVSLEDPQGQGYWITYQDAKDGELIKVDIV